MFFLNIYKELISLTLHLKAVLKLWECFNKYTGELFIDSLYQFVEMFDKLTGFISRFLFIQPAHRNLNLLACLFFHDDSLDYFSSQT